MTVKDERNRDLLFKSILECLDLPSTEGVEDIHYHVMEPRTLRLTVEYRF